MKRYNLFPEMEYFANSQSHLLAELSRIDLMLQWRVRVAREIQTVDPQFQGLYLSDEEMDRLARNSSGLPPWAESPLPEDLQTRLNEAYDRTSLLAQSSERRGVELRLPQLIRAFGLTRFEVDVLLIALAPEFDLRYEKFYAYLQDDVTRKLPTVDLALNLLCRSMEEKLAARIHFEPGASLLRNGLVELRDEPSNALLPFPAKILRIDPGIANFLTGLSAPEARLADIAGLMVPKCDFRDLLLPAHVLSGLRNLEGASGILHFQGPYGAGKKSCAEALCLERGLRLMTVRGSRLVTATDLEYTLRLLARECRLHNAAVFVDGFDAFLDDSKQPQCEALFRSIERSTCLTILASEEAWEPPGFLLKRGFTHVEFSVPTFEIRLALWERLAQTSGVDFEALANQFSFTGGQIIEAINAGRNLAKWRGIDATVTMHDLLTACRSRSNRRLARLATHISPRCTWDDLVIPPERLRQLREICNAVRHRGRVYDSWGFARKLYGKGINILFSGASGTGKTMAAQAMAAELGLDLYKIDLSTIVSKYIGETEKNLSRIFAEARSSNAILFFDEADALFGKRTAVEDAHDRYANIETNYLLQKMEEHDGLAILATNLGKNMDESFTRRLHAIVEFSMPNVEDRLRIWQSVWPKDTPRDSELDLNLMARRFEISGGSIRNIALMAAFLAAADDSGAVGMDHLLRATRLEYQKMRTVITNVNFLDGSG